jgi:hypothetical protein
MKISPFGFELQRAVWLRESPQICPQARYIVLQGGFLGQVQNITAGTEEDNCFVTGKSYIVKEQ